MSFSEKFTKIFRGVLPTPFTIAVLLTVLTFFLALFTIEPQDSVKGHVWLLLEYWERGLWNSDLLVFALQMMLMLVLGHVLALTKPASRFIDSVVPLFCKNTANAAAMVTLFTCLVALFNWGLGLIFGAILARKVGEYAASNGIKINYPIIGAAGYSGLMVWHGGLSGSSLTKVAEAGHLQNMMEGILSQEQIAKLPISIDFSDTVFSNMNMTVSLAVLILLPLAMFLLGSKSTSPGVVLPGSVLQQTATLEKPTGAERLDRSLIVAFVFGALILLVVGYKVLIQLEGDVLKFFTPNNINFLLLGLGVIMHGSFFRFLKAVDSAIGGAAGILIQFPLYFGIMGIMKSSGLVGELSEFFVSISSNTSYPTFTFISSGIVNIFVPSGGGQWAVQGPIIIQAAEQLGVPLSKSIMALAYGDQVTNMLQPFWALPLLGITGLKAKEILPYTLFLMLIGSLIYIGGLLLF